MLKALWTGEYEEYCYGRFSERFEIERAGFSLSESFDDLMDEETLIQALRGKDVLVAGYDELSRRVLEKSPYLKIVLSGRDGPEENIDINACTELGIPVLSGGGRCAHSVSELTLALMFDLARGITRASNYFRACGWTTRDEQGSLAGDNTELFGKTLSIIGLGKNGRALAKIAQGIGMQVVAYDPYVPKDVAQGLGVRMLGLEEAMSAGDFVCALARVSEETKGMIGAEQIAAMKPTAYFINTGRAALTDEDAVLDALESGSIRGAAIDVFSKEPLGTESRYYEIPEDKLLITPHIAGLSVERIAHQYENLIDGLEAYLSGERTISNLYNPRVFESPTFSVRGGLLLE